MFSCFFRLYNLLKFESRGHISIGGKVNWLNFRKEQFNKWTIINKQSGLLKPALLSYFI
jgi:hypothetical protein